MTNTTKRKPVRNDWTGSDIPQASSIPPAVIMRVLKSLDAIRGHAERAPFPDPELCRQHGEREVLVSSFAMIRMMASAAIDKIGQDTGWTVADTETHDAAQDAKIAYQKALLALWGWMTGARAARDAV